eukprot:1157953-Pelagomonas_calceolata.AAC.5
MACDHVTLTGNANTSSNRASVVEHSRRLANTMQAMTQGVHEITGVLSPARKRLELSEGPSSAALFLVLQSDPGPVRTRLRKWTFWGRGVDPCHHASLHSALSRLASAAGEPAFQRFKGLWPQRGGPMQTRGLQGRVLNLPSARIC